VASVDGQNFNILISNPDGTSVAIDAGNFISPLGTGLRFTSLATATPPVTSNATAAAGGVTITPMFVGAQGQFVGLDQVNLQIPQSLAGRGELDLVLTVDGRASNAVRSGLSNTLARFEMKRARDALAVPRSFFEHCLLRSYCAIGVTVNPSK
jgi:hypothetical protein